MKKIITIVGARPQFIKAAMVSHAIAKLGDAGVTEYIVHTGQHFDVRMSDVFFSELQIPQPAYHLGIGGMSHGAMTGKMIEAIERVLIDEKPDWVLVYGDTNSTLAGALAAVKMHIPVAHIEAGLRSFNRRMPEEINRILTDHAADLLFAPTDAAVSNLRNEGIRQGTIVRTGDVMYDAAVYYANVAVAKSTILETLGIRPDDFILATIHRAENTDSPKRLDTIARALCDAARHLPVVLPIHPRTRGMLQTSGVLDDIRRQVKVVDPVGYLDMVMLEKNARVIVTDSGGVQKEAYFHGIPCVTLRGETEWVELVDAGVNRLSPPISSESVVADILAAASDTGIDFPKGLYGDADAGTRIAMALQASS